MAFPFLFWLAYQGCALVLALWAAGSAVPGGGRHGVAQRAWTLCAAILLPCCVAMSALATPLHRPEFHLAAALLPVLGLAAAWSNTLSVARAGLGLKLLHAPVALWNATLCAVFAVRGLQQIGGQDCGDVGATMVAAHTMLQTVCGRDDALTLPVFLHLPLCLPLMSTVSWPHRTALGAAAVVSTILLAILASLMPYAWDHVTHARAIPSAPRPLPQNVQVGVTLSLADRLHTDTETAEQLGLFVGLGADLLCFDADAGLFDDKELLRQVTDELALARNEQRSIMAIARPPRSFAVRPAASLDVFVEEMAKVHWLIAERLAPDWLVLYDGPFGALVTQRAELGTIDQWEAICARGVDDVLRANPRCKPVVVIETRALHGRRMFDLLARRASPLSAVAITLRGEALEPDEVGQALAEYHSWLGSGDGKPVWLLGVGTTPESSGGELGQANFLSRMIDFAASQPRVAGLVVDTLEDRRSFRGLATVDGRTRLAYRLLRSACLRTPAAPR